MGGFFVNQAKKSLKFGIQCVINRFMKVNFIGKLLFFASIVSASTFSGAKENSYDVAAYVWPAYQPEPRWKELGLFKDGTGEWENVYRAVSKKKGHIQPRIPLWGYEPEDDPIVLARKIDACLAAGVNVLIYDWYWYCGRPFLENGVNAFLKAPNNERMKFAIMWANHDVDDLWDRTVPDKCRDKNNKRHIRWKATISMDEFKNVLVPRWIEYFKKPNYYKVNGKPLFQMFFDFDFSDKDKPHCEMVAEALDYFDQKAREAGFAGIEFQMPCGALPLEPKASDKDTPAVKNLRKNLEYYYSKNWRGTFFYNWVELVPEFECGSYYRKYEGRKDMDYKLWGEKAYAALEKKLKDYPDSVIFPSVTCGWDTNSRFPEYVYVPVATDNTPERFEYFLRKAKQWCDTKIPAGYPKLITINSLNEWTEGSYLEPDNINGYGFLNAVARVFGAHGQAK